MSKSVPKLKTIDGSMSSQLKKLGYDAYQHKPHWTMDANADPEMMKAVYSVYANMNIDYITTNTYHFGSTLDKNLSEELQDREKYVKYIETACRELRLVVNDHNLKNQHKCQILGSVGTLATKYHDLSEYNGRYVDVTNAMDIAYNYFYTIFQIFEKRTDIRQLIVETIPTELEGRAILQVLDRFPSISVVMSFTFKEHGLLRHGESIHNLAKKMKACKQVIGIGINCTDPANVLPALKQINPYKFDQVFVYPNIGDQHFQTDEDLVVCPFSKLLVHSWVKNGATVFGGCCGVEDTHLYELKKIVDQFNAK